MLQRRLFACAAAFCCLTLAAQEVPAVKRMGSGPLGAGSLVVSVDRSPLAHTALLLPTDESGSLLHADDAKAQARALLDSLDATLNAAGSKLDAVVKLNVYAATDDAAATVDEVIGEALSAKPAVTYVVNALPLAGALVALDAVAIADRPAAQVTHIPHEGGRASRVSVLPAGRVVYISGQAEAGDSLKEAAANTLASLLKTLEHLAIDASNVVQVKSFLKPIDQAHEVDAALAEAFPEGAIPAAVNVEWSYGQPVEIELIAALPDGAAPQASGRLTFVTPPGMTASPVFSRLCIVDSPTLIYVSGLYGRDAANAEEEVRAIFETLGEALTQTGSDFRHLVKATYYCANDETSVKLNELRPSYYDPERPPAASKSGARGVGLAGQGVVVDMIAVPAE